MRMQRYICTSLLLCFFTSLLQACAYPEFYEYSRKVSGRAINCALCHSHSDGPEGNGAGQIGSLNKEEMERLMKARAAFEPNQKVDSPILNEFGDEIIHTLGKKKFLELKTHPQDFAKELGNAIDVDKDGIKDAEEFLDGTLPTNGENGHPLKLFFANLKKNIFHVIFAFLCVGLLFYGFAQWLMKIHIDAVLKEIKKE